VIEFAAEGTDKITTALDGYTLGANVEWLYLTGATALTGSGNELNNRVYGNNLNNTLYGYAGNDRMNGGVGNDTMIGGVGNDVYVVSSTKDVIVENANEGTDGVEVGFSYTLQANVENLTLGGTGNINGTGNSASNVINGNNANNILNGQSGSDTLVGKLGNDTYLFNRGNMLDTIVENDSTAGNADVLKLGADIRSDQLWFKQVGNNLEVRVIGTTDRTVIRDWYLGDAYHVETINAGDGKTLSHQQVENLVSAMSTMTMPASGQTSLSVSQQSALAPVLAANWH
jgi:Ca2+-binding RTX toxin-like protein